MQKEDSQRSAISAAPLSAAERVVALHDELERNMATFVALSRTTGGPSAVDAAEALQGAADSVARAASQCLRVFSAARRAPKHCGLTTVMVLYGDGVPSAGERVDKFVGCVRATLGGLLPPAVALAATRCLQRHDAAAAAPFAHAQVCAYAAAPGVGEHNAAARALLGDGAAVRRAVLALLWLEAECAAPGSDVIGSYDGTILAQVASSDQLAAVASHQRACAAEAEERQRRLRVRAERRATQHQQQQQTQTQNSAANQGGADDNNLATGAAPSSLTGAGAAERAGSVGQPQPSVWFLSARVRSYVVRAVIAALIGALCRFLISKVLSGSLMRSAPQNRRRVLTL